jgi:hypothetical protein
VRSRLILLLGALALFACTPGGETTTSGSVATTTPSSTTTTTSGGGVTTSTTLPGGTEELPEELRTEIARLIGVAEDLRGHTFLSPPKVVVVSAEELAERVRSQVEEDYEEVDVDQALYKLLGLVGPEFNLRQTISDLYGEQVAGYYDGETEELVVPAREQEFTIVQEVTLVHELTHALTDQVLDFHQHFSNLHDQDQFDQASAFQALIEGDASMTEILFIQQMDPEDQQRLLEDYLQGVDDSVFAGVPQFIQDSLLFPYETGFAFVSQLFERDGFDAVDQAYRDPPLSTEQVLDAARYPDDEPVAIPLPPGSIEGYDLAYGSSWGELGFQLMFDQVLGGAEEAARGWGGDSYNVFFNGSEAALSLRYAGDNENDAAELFSALQRYIDRAMNVGEASPDGSGFSYQGEDYGFVARVGGEVAWVAAADPEVGVQLRSALSDF